jgi:hypothetical protein
MPSFGPPAERLKLSSQVESDSAQIASIVKYYLVRGLQLFGITLFFAFSMIFFVLSTVWSKSLQLFGIVFSARS